MPAKVAVAVIHGIASQHRKRPAVSNELTFSRDLYRRLRGRLGRRRLSQEVAWREIFWSDVLETRQDRFLEKLTYRTRYRGIREFVVKGIGDAASFLPDRSSDSSAYRRVQSRVAETLADLNTDTSDDTPLVILAHSFGGTIMSNYIWDMQQGLMSPPTPFQAMRTISRFVTFGSNMPLFTFALPPEDVQPIRFPGPDLEPGQSRTPWWLNYYDRDDVLGYPLAAIGPKYEALVERGELAEIELNAGGFLTSWNPLSHEQYWTDREFVRPMASIIKGLLDGA